MCVVTNVIKLSPDVSVFASIVLNQQSSTKSEQEKLIEIFRRSSFFCICILENVLSPSPFPVIGFLDGMQNTLSHLIDESDPGTQSAVVEKI